MVNYVCAWLPYTEVPEQKLWKELPATWSQLEPGTACKMTELFSLDPEFMEVERNIRKTCSTSMKQIVSVSGSLLFIAVVLVTAQNNNKQTNSFYSLIPRQFLWAIADSSQETYLLG